MAEELITESRLPTAARMKTAGMTAPSMRRSAAVRSSMDF
jgi:hypothetical protein